MDLEHAHPDPFIRSMALWELKQYGDALDTLLSPAGRLHAARDNNEPVPSVFNFYVYLRTHPRLKRNNMPSQVSFNYSQRSLLCMYIIFKIIIDRN